MVLLDALEAGASAGILALAAFAPHECTEVYRRWRSREREEAVLLQAEAARLHRAVVGQYSVPGVKAALDILGMAGGPPRPPLRPLGAAERGTIEQALGVRRLAEAPPSRA
jgi:4-hydroxy-2-oxoglutarate aldolase